MRHDERRPSSDGAGHRGLADDRAAADARGAAVGDRPADLLLERQEEAGRDHEHEDPEAVRARRTRPSRARGTTRIWNAVRGDARRSRSRGRPRRCPRAPAACLRGLDEPLCACGISRDIRRPGCRARERPVRRRAASGSIPARVRAARIHGGRADVPAPRRPRARMRPREYPDAAHPRRHHRRGDPRRRRGPDPARTLTRRRRGRSAVPCGRVILGNGSTGSGFRLEEWRVPQYDGRRRGRPPEVRGGGRPGRGIRPRGPRRGPGRYAAALYGAAAGLTSRWSRRTASAARASTGAASRPRSCSRPPRCCARSSARPSSASTPASPTLDLGQRPGAQAGGRRPPHQGHRVAPARAARSPWSPGAARSSTPPRASRPRRRRHRGRGPQPRRSRPAPRPTLAPRARLRRRPHPLVRPRARAHRGARRASRSSAVA